MNNIKVHVNLYGSISKVGGGKYVAQMEVEMPADATKLDLLAHLGIRQSERGYLFINAMLCDVPGLVTGASEALHDGDRVGIFSVDRMWPYQYRDGIVMSEGLRKAMEIHGAMHHTYTGQTGE